MSDRQYTTRELMKRFIPYFAKYKWILLLDLFAAALTTMCELVLPLIMRYITNQGFSDSANLTMLIVLKLGGLYLILRMIDLIAEYYMSNIGHVMGAKMETDMRRDAYAHLQKLSNTFYSNTKVGQIMGRITNDLFDVTEFSHHCPEEFFIAGIKILVSFIVLIQINVMLTVIIFILVPLMVIACSGFNQKMKSAFAEQRNQIGELNSAIEESLLGQRVVKAFTNEDIENEKFEKDNRKFLGFKRKGYLYLAGFHCMTRGFDGLMYLCVLILGGIGVVNRVIDAGDLVAYMLYVTTLIATIRRIIEFSEQFQRGITGIQRFAEIMDAEIEIFDEEDAVPLEHTQGNIEFEDVSFSYPDDHNKVFRHLNLTVKSGEKVAIVGPSGGGKTTLCNLIPRFYDVTKGRILIDGVDIKNYTLKSLRQSIGIVQQDVYLFSGTVFDNIIYGRLDASREEVIDAAKKAGAHDFIMELKDGYDTYIGERGVKLSGGQKQRISIARVFLKNPPIIILDEATSALDNESEFYVATSLDELAKGRTTLTIAHRLSSIKNSHRIMVLTEEGIVEEGTHQELLEKQGLYENLYNMAERIR